MGPRNLLILFFSTVAVSLVVLIIFFSLFFKNINLDFNTRLPESAPDLGGMYDRNQAMPVESKADGILRSTVNVPTESREPAGPTAEEAARAEAEPLDGELAPVSDDAILEEEPPVPVPGGRTSAEKPSSAGPMENAAQKPAQKPAAARSTPPVAPTPRTTVERKPPSERPEPPPPADELQPLVPPVPSQGNAKPPTSYRVVMGRYGTAQEADAAAARAASAGAVAVVKQSGGRYVVQLGSFANRRNAEALAGQTGASVEPSH